MVRRRLHVLAWVIGVFSLVLFGLRTFVANVYPVRSGSMKPTLWADRGDEEQVLVRFVSAEDLQRYDLVVLRRGDELFVKRLVGLPGESVQVRGGDLWIGGELVPDDLPKPPWISVFVANTEVFERRFEFDVQGWIPWSSEAGRLRIESLSKSEVDGLGVGLPVATSSLLSATAERLPWGSPVRIGGGREPWSFEARWRGPLRDGLVGPEGEVEAGQREVGDLRIVTRILPRERCGSLDFELTREGGRYRAELRFGAEGSDLVTHASQRDGPWTRLDVTSLEAFDGATEFEFALRDRCLSVVWGGRTVWSHRVEEPTRAFPQAGPMRTHIKPRLTIRARGAVAVDLDDLRVDRDLHYTGRGDLGVLEPMVLGPDEYFVLGDNSAISADSREWGPVRADQVVGRASAVVWPPSRWRRLVPTVDPQARR